MMIQVQYTDNRFDYVNPVSLDCLLDQDKLLGFKRSSGWVRVGIDPVRQSRRSKPFVRPVNFYHTSLLALQA